LAADLPRGISQVNLFHMVNADYQDFKDNKENSHEGMESQRR